MVAYFAQHPAQHEWEATILDAKNLIRNKTLDSSILRKLLFLRQLEAISSFLSLIRSNAVAFISNEQSINASPKMHSEEGKTDQGNNIYSRSSTRYHMQLVASVVSYSD